MIIALDYDDTFTADKELWTAFVRNAQAHGHAISFVTFRFEGRQAGNDDILGDARALGIDVVFTGGRQKAHCFNADIWIDDKPVMIPSATAMQQMLIGCERMGDVP